MEVKWQGRKIDFSITMMSSVVLKNAFHFGQISIKVNPRISYVIWKIRYSFFASPWPISRTLIFI